jgi:uncharacterized damage-inducible protein DinB
VTGVASPYVIDDLEGYTPQIARLVQMMTYVRETTIDTVRGLSIAQLDHLHDEESNSIGALLSHVGAVEVAYQAATFEDRGLTDAELSIWGAALDLGPRARREIRGRDLKHYLDALAAVRAKTLAAFAERNDDWLYEERPFWNRLPANNYFKWFHVFEDELNHRGQMRWLVKRLPNR